MRRCFYHTDLVQNAVVHNFSRQIAFIQFRTNFQNHLYGQPVLTFDKRQICKEILKELRVHMIKDSLCLFFINGFITMCNLKKRLIRAAFLSTPASDVHERLKTNGKAMKIVLLRLLTINKEM